MIKLALGLQMNNDIIGSDTKDWINIDTKINAAEYLKLLDTYKEQIATIKKGGGDIAIEKQHSKGKMTARERISYLIDDDSFFNEIGLFAGYEMYEEYGSPPAGGVIIAIVKILGLDCMVIANDATVKAGAYFEISLKKTLRAQKIALENNLPVIYLVDSAGVFLPLQDQVFPDEGHFGRIFYNNAKLSSFGIPQIASVMGPCIAGGAYLPVMCDKYIITEGANMFLAAPALVKAAIGQNIDSETLGGAKTHSSISGTADYHEKNDYESLKRIRSIVEHINFNKNNLLPRTKYNISPKNNIIDLLKSIDFVNNEQYNMIELILRIVDDGLFHEYKESYGKTIICGNCMIGHILL